MSAKPIIPIRPGLAQARERSTPSRLWPVGVGAVAIGVANESEMRAGSLGVHGGQSANDSGQIQDPANEALLAERLRLVCAARGISYGQLARWWGVSRTTAFKSLNRESGPGLKKIAKLPESVRRELEAA